MDDFRREFLRS
jgi:carboxy-cis,cis-muconate cyclase